MPDAIETEVKIEVSDLEPIRQRLRLAGAELREIVDEENVYLDRDGELARRDESLRLRHDNRTRLTWKGASRFQEGIVQRPEIEIIVSSFRDTLAIFERLGFTVVDRLRKRRETWIIDQVQVTLDSLAFGQFVELEGAADAITTAAQRLELDLARGLSSSYRALQRARQTGESSQSRTLPAPD